MMKEKALFVVLSILIMGMVVISLKDSPILYRTEVENLIMIKGVNTISWNDFDKYEHKDVGSGNYVYQYELVDGSFLYLSGNSLDSPPMYIYIVDRNKERVDLKK